jgi:hypothetical protein
MKLEKCANKNIPKIHDSPIIKFKYIEDFEMPNSSNT